MAIFRIFLLLCILSLAFCEKHLETDPHLLSRPMMIELPENLELRSDDSIEEIRLRCVNWRVGVEAKDVSPWKAIPAECVDYVKEYMLGGSYEIDLEIVSNEAAEFAKSVELKGDGMDAWVFDVDETLLSNLAYYSHHGYGRWRLRL
ncbi:putative Acid phosphatase [Helianthus debilis subsp. tardiflorus]